MEGAEAGRREMWRKEGEMRGKNSRFKKINDESYYMIIVIYT